MFYWVAKITISRGQMEFDKTDPHCSVALSTSNVFLLIYCKLKTNFIANSQILYMGCLLTRECKQKKNPILIFRSVRIRLRECPLTGMCKCRVWLGGKTGTWKGILKYSCPLTRVSVSWELTVNSLFCKHLHFCFQVSMYNVDLLKIQ